MLQLECKRKPIILTLGYWFHWSLRSSLKRQMLINSLLPTAHKLLPILSVTHASFWQPCVRLQSTVSSQQLKDVCQNFRHLSFVDRSWANSVFSTGTRIDLSSLDIWSNLLLPADKKCYRFQLPNLGFGATLMVFKRMWMGKLKCFWHTRVSWQLRRS